METSQILQETTRRLKKLSPEKLMVAADFVAYLDSRQNDDATRELLEMPGLVKAYDRAKREARSGKLVSLESVIRKKRNV